MSTPSGYQWLIEAYKLPTLPRATACFIDSSVRGREERVSTQQTHILFNPQYQAEDSLSEQLQFALKYESVDLSLLALLFESINSNELCQWLRKTPSSVYARRACFFYEWLTGNELPLEGLVPSKSRYVDALNPDQQFCAKAGSRSKRYHIIDNLPGTRDFCPLVRKTDFLNAMEQKDLQAQIKNTLAQYDPDLLQRAAAFLYLKETQSSFEVEREKPNANKAQRFADLLKQADTRTPLTAERLSQLQNAVIDPRFHEYIWRSEQNWIGKDLGYRKQIDFVPVRPNDLPSLMKGLIYLAEHDERHSSGVALAASIAFGFVYAHPFMDGNGRIHRYLIHHMLSAIGFTPRGIVLPVSAVILANLNDYIDVLEYFSRPLNQLTDYSPDTPDIPAKGNEVLYFRYFDATQQTEFLYRALERTIKEDLQKEIDYLLGFDLAYKQLNELLDWPAHNLELFIRVVQNNDGQLSKAKRKSHFDWMSDEEISEAETVVSKNFRLLG
jgi:hypothetical protein